MKLFFILTLLITPIFSNPFLNQKFYINPTFQQNIQTTISNTTDTLTLENLRIAQNTASAFWLDTMSKVQLDGVGTNTLAGILKDANSKPVKELVVVIIYDLPNRDCAARASNGEICCAKNPDGSCNYQSTDCTTGISQYQHGYIDPIVKLFKQYPKLPIVAIIEPDSLPNLVTNLGNPNCASAATQASYKTGITYAVNQIAENAPHVQMYLDCSHGGWLGWLNNAQGFQTLVNSLGIVSKIRGFATNVANYNGLGIACPKANWCLPNANHQSDPCCADPCKLTEQWNPSNNELNFVLLLSTLFPTSRFIIDTGRNGVENARTECSLWCNCRKTGMGYLPTTKTGLPDLVDAYYWLKISGETDGCTEITPDGNRCARFDSMCASSDSIGSKPGEPKMPSAGQWSIYQAQMLARNANFGPDIPTIQPVIPIIPNPTTVNPKPVTKTQYNCDGVSVFLHDTKGLRSQLEDSQTINGDFTFSAVFDSYPWITNVKWYVNTTLISSPKTAPFLMTDNLSTPLKFNFLAPPNSYLLKALLFNSTNFLERQCNLKIFVSSTTSPVTPPPTPVTPIVPINPPTPVPSPISPPSNSPVNNSATCVNTIYLQCDGLQFTGQKCCGIGLYCIFSNPWYSQCQQVSPNPTEPTITPPTPAPIQPTITPSTPTPTVIPPSPSQGYWKCEVCA
jgi:cellulose 1,4-beta-cellobiosidase